MSSCKTVPTCAVPPNLSWHSLVERSISAWNNLFYFKDGAPVFDDGEEDIFNLATANELLRQYDTLDKFLRLEQPLMFWFFHRREAFLAQKSMTKWSRDRLDEYVLLPATSGCVSRQDCFFMSHFWHSKEDPDPDGTYLRLHQQELGPDEWSYIWVDWTCIPQAPRSIEEEIYFTRSLATVSGIIRNSGFTWFYPPFEARMWILYEVAEFILTSSGAEMSSDIRTYVHHIHEMIQDGVHSVLDKYGYKCSNDRDKAYLTSWLDLLVLFRRIGIGLFDTREILNKITYMPSIAALTYLKADDVLILKKFDGTLEFKQKTWTFTPFPTVWGLEQERLIELEQ